MNVELRPLAEIRPYDKNPRVNDDAVEAVARSIREFGFRQPIVVDADLVIICGHTRYKAAQKLGLQQVPIHIATDLTPEQIKAYRIADNRTAELSDWNFDLLPIELSELSALNYDLGLLGFDQDELARLLDPGVQTACVTPTTCRRRLMKRRGALAIFGCLVTTAAGDRAPGCKVPLYRSRSCWSACAGCPWPS